VFGQGVVGEEAKRFINLLMPSITHRHRERDGHSLKYHDGGVEEGDPRPISPMLGGGFGVTNPPMNLPSSDSPTRGEAEN
jgi:hypothetical protein